MMWHEIEVVTKVNGIPGWIRLLGVRGVAGGW